MSYRQLAALIIVFGAIAAGIGVVKFGEMNANRDQSMASLQETSNDVAASQNTSVLDNRQEFAINETIGKQLLALTSEIESLREDLNAVKKEGNDDPIDITVVETRIASLEKKVSSLSATKRTSNEEVLVKEIEQLNELISNLELKIEQLEAKIEMMEEQMTETQQEKQTEDVPDQVEQEVVEEEEPKDFTVKSLTASTNMVKYKLGETVIISGKTDPNVPIDMVVIHDDRIVFNTKTKSDAAGVYVLEYKIQTGSSLGWYNAIVSAGDKNSNLLFKVIDAQKIYGESENGNVSISVVSTSYSRGDYISVTGEAPPRSKIVITIMPPSGNESSAIVMTDEHGKYQKLFQLTLDASSGEWTLSANYNGEVASIKIKVL